MAETTKIVDPKKLAKREAKKALREKQAKAFENLKAVINKQNDQATLKALQEFVGLKATRTQSTGGGANYDKFVAFVNEKKSVGEDVIFKEFKVGRKDCAGFIRKYLKNCEPKNRIWINFTPSDGLYKVIGTGLKAPESYSGYVPTDDITDLRNPSLK